jgi:hypothetical protein
VTGLDSWDFGKPGGTKFAALRWCEDAGVYRYLTVRSDCRYGESVPARVLVELLDSVPGLRRTGLAFCEAESGLDWLHLALIACDGAGTYAVHKGRCLSGSTWWS